MPRYSWALSTEYRKTLNVGHQTRVVRTSECQEGDGHEFAHFGRDVGLLATDGH
jgi:hypothetical protein